MLTEAVSAHLKMIGVHCLRMNREVGLQGNPNPKDVHNGGTFLACIIGAPFSHKQSDRSMLMICVNYKIILS